MSPERWKKKFPNNIDINSIRELILQLNQKHVWNRGFENVSFAGEMLQISPNNEDYQFKIATLMQHVET